MESTRELLATAAGQLRAAGVPTPDVDAELLLAHVTRRPRALLRMSGDTVTGAQSEEFAALVVQRVARVPLQHLTGVAPFRHLELGVGPGVFVPRPETELMVDHVLAFVAARATADLLVVDLCAGSGALALSIATELPGTRVIAVELSPEAAVWARRNIVGCAAQVSAAGSTIELIEADATRVSGPDGCLGDLTGRVDVVVTNPPYVPDAAIPREPEVRDHDPELALYGGPDGLEVVRPLAEQAAVLLRAGGLLVVEHADVQGEAAGEAGVPSLLRSQLVPARLHRAGQPGAPLGTQTERSQAPDSIRPPAWREVTDHLDLAGRPRHTSAIRAPGRMAS